MNIQDKTAATNAISVSTIDAKRADKTAYEIIYEEFDENGHIKTDYSGDDPFTNS